MNATLVDLYHRQVAAAHDRQMRLAVHGRVPPKASPPTDAPVEPDPAGGANRPVRTPPWSVTPGRYGDPETSALSLTLNDASQTFDIDLRP